MTIEFAERMTIISGHNGIGKSTIMGLVANGSGYSSTKYRSLFGRTFQGNLFEITFIDYAREFHQPRADGVTLPEPQIDYLVNSHEVVIKTCSMTGRNDSAKARVVPRNFPKKPFTSADGTVVIGRDAKVPLPTLYLGMTRMLPVGEANPKWVRTAIDKVMDQVDAKFISDFINDVIPGTDARADAITTLDIRGTAKSAKHPGYSHDPRCVSLGQDSLASIATALASFNRLKRLNQEYPGGLLVIDELDAGLHPHAQRKLVRRLRKTARDLSLQVIATTHSTYVIDEVHPEGQGQKNAPDRVVYLMDTGAPRLAVGYNLRQINDDMNLLLPTPEKAAPVRQVRIFFEDDEAVTFFERIVPTAFKRRLKDDLKAKLDVVGWGIGGSNLQHIAKKVRSFFRVAVIVVDADTSVTGTQDERANVLKLPGGLGPTGKGLSPEASIHAYYSDVLANREAHAEVWKKFKSLNLSGDHIREHLLRNDVVIADRESAKKWWRNVEHMMKNYKLIELWAANHTVEVQDFLSRLRTALSVVVQRAGG